MRELLLLPDPMHWIDMTLEADVYWSFRSPYSYLATRRYVELTEKYDLRINQRFVYPLAIREPDFFEKAHPNWLGYTFRDVFRVAQYMGIPMAPPNPDPIVQDIATRKIADEQPYIFELTRIGQAASRRDRGLEFANEVSQLIWGGTSGWHEGDHLEKAAARAGLDFAELKSEAQTQPDELDAEIANNQKALEATGHWGVPTLVFDGEPFFGQDRIDLAVWRMQQKGLVER
jgi:2-hydroxychromene-2-carboxylate isomerase